MRCNNHKCVWLPLWRGLPWSCALLKHVTSEFVAKFWYKCLLTRSFSSAFSCLPFAMVTRSNKMEIRPPEIAFLQPGVDVDQVNWMLSNPTSNRGLHSHLPPTRPSARAQLPPTPDLLTPTPQTTMPQSPWSSDSMPCPSSPPRTWICHAYQRRSDKSFGQDTCHQHQCPLLRRPGSSNTRSRMVFRLDLRYHADMLPCLQSQPFVTIQDHARFDWKVSVPAPLTYAEGLDSLVQPIAPNFYDPDRLWVNRPFCVVNFNIIWAGLWCGLLVGSCGPSRHCHLFVWYFSKFEVGSLWAPSRHCHLFVWHLSIWGGLRCGLLVWGGSDGRSLPWSCALLKHVTSEFVAKFWYKCLLTRSLSTRPPLPFIIITLFYMPHHTDNTDNTRNIHLRVSPRFFLLGSHRVLCCFHTKFFQTHGGYGSYFDIHTHVVWVTKILWVWSFSGFRTKRIQDPRTSRFSQRNQQQRPRASPHQDPSLEEKVRWTQRCLRWNLFYPKNTWSDCSSFSQLRFQVSNDVSMWKTWTPCLSLCFFGGTKWFQSKEGDSGIHYNPHLLRPSECGRSCGISGFLGHWRMLAEGTPCPNQVVTSMFFIWKKCERCGITCETPSFKSWSRTFYSHHASSKFRKKNKSGRMMVGVKGVCGSWEQRYIFSFYCKTVMVLT